MGGSQVRSDRAVNGTFRGEEDFVGAPCFVVSVSVVSYNSIDYWR